MSIFPRTCSSTVVQTKRHQATPFCDTVISPGAAMHACLCPARALASKGDDRPIWIRSTCE
eukprot:944796-Pleurochrysis_carterae.AAC.8